MSKPRPLTEAERTELVAYLDGELSGDAKRAIEARVSLDPTWRAEADSLKRIWQLLDYLPQAEASAGFTQRTLSKLEPVRRSGRKKPSVPGFTARHLLKWVAVAAGWAAA